MFVGASKVPSVVRANAEVVALCRIVSAVGETTAQLPAPRRVREAILLAVRLIRTASAACSSPTYVAVPDTAVWSYVAPTGPASARRLLISSSVVQRGRWQKCQPVKGY